VEPQTDAPLMAFMIVGKPMVLRGTVLCAVSATRAGVLLPPARYTRSGDGGDLTCKDIALAVVMDMDLETRRLYHMRHICSLAVARSLRRLNVGDVFIPKGAKAGVIRARGRIRSWDRRLEGWHPFTVDQPGKKVEGWIRTKTAKEDRDGTKEADIVFVARTSPPVPIGPFRLGFFMNRLNIPEPTVTEAEVADAWIQ